MLNVVYTCIVLLTNIMMCVRGEFPCVCTYQLETSVFKSRSNASSVVGYLYEFDCKPTFPLDHTRNSDYITIQFEGQVGYIVNTPGVLTIESCPGSISAIDKVLITTSRVSLSSTQLLTNPHPTTMSTTPQPTTISTTPQPMTMSTTLKPTTMSTTPTPTTMSTTPTPTTMSTTPTPTTMSTTPTPTTMSTTQKPTTTSTTPKATTMSTTPTPTTAPMTTFTLASTVARSDVKCRAGWVFYGSSCYAFHVDAQNHSFAMTMCQRNGSYLVNINSREEQNMIANHISINLYHSRFWTGGVWTNGSWVWLNGMSEPQHSDYVNWNAHFPQNHPGPNLCVALMGSKNNFTWRDFDCSKEYDYICEQPATGSKIGPTTKAFTSTSTSSGPCSDHWVQYGSSCYRVKMNGHYTHSKAEAECKRRDSHLVYIDSEDEQRALEGFLNRSDHYIKTSQQDDEQLSSVWIGGRFDDQRGWVWGNTSMAYTNWQPNYPIPGRSRCVAMVGKYDSRWRDYKCDGYRFNYICERPVFTSPALVG